MVEPISSKLLLWLLSFVSKEQESSSSKEREMPFMCVIRHGSGFVEEKVENESVRGKLLALYVSKYKR